MGKFISSIIRSLLPAFRILRRNDPLVLASSTAFFATFSLSPILIILVNVLGIYLRRGPFSRELFSTIGTTFGDETAVLVRSIVENVNAIRSSWIFAALGFLFLLFVATTLLHVVKNAINRLWSVRKKEAARVRYTVRERVMGIALIIATGLLFNLSLFLDTLLAMLHDFFDQIVPAYHMTIVNLLKRVFSLVVVTLWFTILFKVLPDARIGYRIATTGGFLTAIMFIAGKGVMGVLLKYELLASVFGASAAFALLLLFIFYSSLILYYGAAFTYAFARTVGRPVAAGRYGDQFEIRVIGREGE